MTKILRRVGLGAAMLLPFAATSFGVTFQEWKSSKFNSSELAYPSISGDSADPDGDGRTNLMEYALGLEPLVADTDEVGLFEETPGQSFTYPEVISISDLTYHVDFTTDLQKWSRLTPNAALRDVLYEENGKRFLNIWNPNISPSAKKWFSRLFVKIDPGGPNQFLPPDGLSASLTIPFSVNLAWNDNTRLEGGYAIERRVGTSGSWQEIATTIEDRNRLSDWDIAGSTQYFYRVSAWEGEFASEYSNEISILTPLDTDGDGIPDDLEATYGTNAWLFSSGGNGVSDGWWIQHGLSPFTASNLDTDGDGRSDAQEFLDGTDPLTPDDAPTAGWGAPSTPSGLSLKTLSGGSNILEWTNASSASGIIIERTENGADWQTVGVVPGSETTFKDGSALPDTVYFYRLVAFN